MRAGSFFRRKVPPNCSFFFADNIFLMKIGVKNSVEGKFWQKWSIISKNFVCPNCFNYSFLKKGATFFSSFPNLANFSCAILGGGYLLFFCFFSRFTVFYFFLIIKL